MNTEDQERHALFDKLYEQHGKPLESSHYGQYLAVYPDGRSVVGADLREVASRAKAEFGRGSFLFKIGTKALGRWR